MGKEERERRTRSSEHVFVRDEEKITDDNASNDLIHELETEYDIVGLRRSNGQRK